MNEFNKNVSYVFSMFSNCECVKYILDQYLYVAMKSAMNQLTTSKPGKIVIGWNAFMKI